METYEVFGLTVQSELKIACLRSREAAKPDLTIVFGPVEKSGLEGPVRSGPHVQSKPGHVWLCIPGIARFLVTRGECIVIDPVPGVEAHALGLFVLGSCMGAIMHQRGCLVLHGSAMRFGDQCVVFAGESGAGKSTTAAGLFGRGHELLADDLCVIDGEGRVLPGPPQIKLWADAALKLGVDTDPLIRVRPEADKYAYPIGEGHCANPMPLGAVYILGTHEGDDIRFGKVQGAEKMKVLKSHTFRFEYVLGMGLQARHLLQTGRLANRIEVMTISRPASGMPLEEFLDRLDARFHTMMAES